MVGTQSIQVDPELDIQRLIQGYTNSGDPNVRTRPRMSDDEPMMKI